MTSLLLAVALLGLGVATIVSGVAFAHSNARVTKAHTVLASYAALQRAVGGEAFAEAGYRRAPSRAARSRIDQSVRSVDEAVAGVRSAGNRRDGSLLSYVRLLNDRYAREVRSTLDAPRVLDTDDRVAGPALDAIQRLIDEAIAGHRGEVARATAQQQRLVRQLAVVLPAVFVLALGTLVLSWRLMLREHRRLRGEAADSENRAVTDALTGLPNRVALGRMMDGVLATRDGRSALLFMDLDGFKPVNDEFGHHAGDEVLREIARRLTDVVRPADTVARLGGDEFAVFLPRTENPQTLAAKILAAVGRPIFVEEAKISVGASIGIACAPEDGHDRAALLRAADAALYQAKNGGRGRACASQPRHDPTTQPRAVSEV